MGEVCIVIQTRKWDGEKPAFVSAREENFRSKKHRNAWLDRNYDGPFRMRGTARVRVYDYRNDDGVYQDWVFAIGGW